MSQLEPRRSHTCGVAECENSFQIPQPVQLNFTRYPLIISMHTSFSSRNSSCHNLIQKQLLICAATLLQLAICLAIMSETSSTAGKHWSDEEVNHLLDRLAKWQREGDYGDGGNFPQSAFTAASQYLRTKGFTRTRPQCQSKYGGVRTYVLYLLHDRVFTRFSAQGNPQGHIHICEQHLRHSLGQHEGREHHWRCCKEDLGVALDDQGMCTIFLILFPVLIPVFFSIERNWHEEFQERGMELVGQNGGGQSRSNCRRRTCILTTC